jgi:hypothetical protein
MCNPVTTSHPDSLLLKGEHAGFEWEVTSNGIGYRCGYVRIPAGHPWHGSDIDDEALGEVEVHGGLTFAAADTDCGKGGEDNAWWVGFDCAHAGDSPDPEIGRGAIMLGLRGTIRTTGYVAAECRRLADQAAAAGL